jgi:hypothetical protein
LVRNMAGQAKLGIPFAGTLPDPRVPCPGSRSLPALRERPAYRCGP